MLVCEKIQPAKLAYDRPSPKLLAFLKKHYGLVDYVPQNNNFVVYNQYFAAGIASSAPKMVPIPKTEEEKAAKAITTKSEQPPAVISKDLYEKWKAGVKGKENKESDDEPKTATSASGCKSTAAFHDKVKASSGLVPPYAVDAAVKVPYTKSYGKYK